jgi:hypothetical protein
MGSGVPHLQGTSMYFPQFFLSVVMYSSLNLILNGFSSKIIQYMARGRDNSSNLGAGLPTSSAIYEN